MMKKSNPKVYMDWVCIRNIVSFIEAVTISRACIKNIVS
jgi:hypothetical protein